MKHYNITIEPKRFRFKRPAGTSRGVYTERVSWYIFVSKPEIPDRVGIGECAPLPKLSCDDLPDYEEILARFCSDLERTGTLDLEALRPYPSMAFGLETALRHLEVGHFSLWNTSFSKGITPITINGLIWMGTYEDMKRQIDAKLAAGFGCVKLKIGAIEFDKELELLRFIRSFYPKEKIELRVDANGAFSPTESMSKLETLAELDLHSIEQPIKAGQREVMARLSEESPLPIALDEELIGVNTRCEKRRLLEEIRPRYIVLKPSLHGGMMGTDEWIKEAERLGIGWWITSALESNIGLNSIAQLCATYDNRLPQGLGTGQLFEENYDVPLRLIGDKMWFKP
jgi:o-succinylbenzoate synthase